MDRSIELVSQKVPGNFDIQKIIFQQQKKQKTNQKIQPQIPTGLTPVFICQQGRIDCHQSRRNREREARGHDVRWNHPRQMDGQASFTEEQNRGQKSNEQE